LAQYQSVLILPAAAGVGMKRKQKLGTNIHKKIFFGLLLIVVLLGSLNLAKARGKLIPSQPELPVVDNTVDLSDMALEQKIAQMVIVAGGRHNQEAWKRMQVGGIHLFALQDEELYRKTIAEFQAGMPIPFFVTIDLEGCWNPFANFKQFPAAREITRTGEAFEKGEQEGTYLVSLGFTINFAPVVDLDDQIWKCRSFPGNEQKISGLAEAYILGLQKERIIATAKHYPGKTLAIRDPHKFLIAAETSEKDVYPYLQLKPTVKGIMINHLISSGAVDSQGVPSVASPAVVDSVRNNFSGLIISDEINMLGVRNFYSSLDELYLAVFKAGNDLILNFNEDPNEIHRMIQVVAKAVERGEIPEEQVDASVTRILQAKSFVVR